MAALLFLVALALLILVHEAGHFFAARLCGMRVLEFGVGFPPRLSSFRRGGTEYSLNALPFGGFVRILGEDPGDEIPPYENPENSFSRKSKGAQGFVLVAGVAANLAAAWLLFAAGFMIGMPATPESARFGEVTDAALTIVRVFPGSPAAEAELLPGDKILAVEGEGEILTPADPAALSALIEARAGREIVLRVARGGEERLVALRPALGLLPENPERAAVGIATGMVGTLALGPFSALLEGGALALETTAGIAAGIGSFLLSAATLEADLASVAGPVGIVALAGDASSLGGVYFLSFIAFISINLALINLIPFPALDGGRLLFLGIEALKGSPLPVKAVRTANAVGFGLLILLMIAVTYHDILRLVS